MPKQGTLTKADIINAVAEQTGFTQKKSYETIEIMLEIIKSSLESGVAKWAIDMNPAWPCVFVSSRAGFDVVIYTELGCVKFH